MTKPRIFISYSRLDGDWAQSFARSLKHLGVEAWLDRDEIAPGQVWLDRAEKALRESDVLAVVLNSAEALRPDLLFEVGAAVGMGKRLVAIFPKELEPSKLPYPLRIRQGIERETPEETAKKLVAATQAR